MITIKNLDTQSKKATINLDYEDALCLLNSMYQVSKFSDIDKDANFDEVYSKIILLQSLLKHGHVPEWELGQIFKLVYGDRKPDEEFDG